jgi:predicted membrane channel-forming protein YqfA (hemolysin III family)
MPVIEALAFVAMLMALASTITMLAMNRMGEKLGFVVIAVAWTGAIFGIAMIGDVLVGMVGA